MMFMLSLIIAAIEIILIKLFLGFAWPAAIVLGLFLGFTTTFVLNGVEAFDWFD